MSKIENKEKVSTEMELVLEQTQQSTSYEVSISAEGVEALKRKVKIKGEKKEALLTLRKIVTCQFTLTVLYTLRRFGNRGCYNSIRQSDKATFGFRFESFSIMGDRRSKEDDLQKIPISIFATNFPEQTNVKELWSIYKKYGNVIDAFIPSRRSKFGKCFGVVRFIKVSDVDLLVNNLCTIWIGTFKLYANVTRFNRLLLNKGSQHADPTVKVRIPSVETINRGGAYGISNLYIQAFKTGTSSKTVMEDSKPSMVLDHSCYNNFDSILSFARQTYRIWFIAKHQEVIRGRMFR
uniref:Nucleotide-binding alpha-beta plait domain-containing protein n=1 Tax=Tanacetum cinerariifolium TaxID=118510 RepID=A0A6L2NKV7_TANCI|nr:nucleotide-binding alpha-beta plait domain-containing protein [Tanacetum cinerariifolium]